MRSEKVVSIPDNLSNMRLQPAECEKHGQFEQKVTVILNRELKGGCPECLRMANEEREAVAEAGRAYELRLSLARKLGDALIPKRFTTRTLENYQAENEGQRRALAFCRHYVKVFDEILKTGRCMVMIGKPGTGKTHLGVAMANDLLHNTSRTAVYRTVGAILQAIRATYDRYSERSEAEILASLISPDLLVLDEVGVSKEQPSDFELTTLFAIINGRYEQERPTVVISNLAADQLSPAMGERCVDRLREGGMIVVPFEWESQRGKEGF
ncbi:IstB ATP binding domain-containing protein [Pseudomonas sp. M47T1]|uniref:ATP-binding protein n=1 Tax=Pseudomonas sp. M47T1 TaxID=1179778 RepID=UPI000260882D|nr:ATP-binding protein [Pseudomonas sp. M47T1]EIK96079.1 IstB ATP binding domain-containing protein [Pseudomonas sp. M47T1]